MKQIYPATITGKSFAPGGSVLDHNFGAGDQYTLGVEEEYMFESDGWHPIVLEASRPGVNLTVDS